MQRLFQQRTAPVRQDLEFEKDLMKSGYFQGKRNPMDEKAELYSSLSQSGSTSDLGDIASAFFQGAAGSQARGAARKRQEDFDEQIQYLRELSNSAMREKQMIQDYNAALGSIQPTVAGVIAQWGGMDDPTRQFAAQEIIDQLAQAGGEPAKVSMVDGNYNVLIEMPDGTTVRENLLELTDRNDPRVQEALKMSTMTGIQDFQKKLADIQYSQARARKYDAEAQQYNVEDNSVNQARSLLAEQYGVDPQRVPVQPIQSLTTGARTKLQAEAAEVNKAAQNAEKIADDLQDYRKTADQIDQILQAEKAAGRRRTAEFTQKEKAAIRNLQADAKAGKYFDESTIGSFIANPQLRSRVYKQIKDIANLTETLALTDTKGATTGLKLKYTEKRVPFVAMDKETKNEIIANMNNHIQKVKNWADYFDLSLNSGYVPSYGAYQRGLAGIKNQPQQQQGQSELSNLSDEELEALLMQSGG